ncbi:DNA mismatch repair protein MutS [Vulgatibacter sp.]|uniref:DNA mismatch repair protein MutS n=1 Tax=Vulgatibacter sp. TaxID=1971226 RepID=UPI0035695B2F
MSTQPAAPPEIAFDGVTPLMRQYLETKAQHQDAILFFRLGDFYEMFFEDAVQASQALGIVLTSRSKGDNPVPMCGFPYHAARGYIAKLIEQGFKVAICEQVEDAATAKTLVRREVTQLVTPGMVLDEQILDAHADHFLAAVVPLEDRFGFALLDASTGEFRAAEVGDRKLLLDELGRAAPREVIVPPGSGLEEALRSACATAFVHDHPDESAFDPRRAEERIKRQLGVASLDGFGLTPLPAATAAAGAALAYLGDTQRGTTAAHVDRITVFHPEGHLVLDEATVNNLEIARGLQGGKKKGSLLGLLDKTLTPMGGRTLSRWILYPLLDLEAIRARHDAVEELAGRGVLREELSGLLKELSDLERILGRLSLRAGNARDLRALGLSLERLPALREQLGGCTAPLLHDLVPELSGLDPLAADLRRAIADEPPVTTREGGMFAKGWDPALDELIDLSTSGKEFLARLEAEERERTGISSLKVRFNKVFGYFIEITRSNLHLVPADYLRKQTTVNAERFVTEALKTYEEKVLTAEEKRVAREIELYEELRQRILSQAGGIKRAAAAIATVDTLLSLARIAADWGYVRPEVDDSDVLEIVEGRHPVVERALAGEAFVPNDVHLDREGHQVVVITGPNMAGKSTVLRQAALIALLAQAGSFVPAARARIGLVDRIFCRVGASDNLARGQSTFMVEMVETAAILHGATARSLVVLDEIGRGTSTFDGLSIAWAVAEHLHDRVGARTLFATHYHELVELAREKSRVKNATVAVSEQGGKVIFLRKLIAGGASRSYGIEVARLAGLPAEVLGRAREILVNLEKNELDPEGRAVFAGKGRARKASVDQLALFAPKAERPAPGIAALLEQLQAVEIDRTTPLQALALLAELQEKARKA